MTYESCCGYFRNKCTEWNSIAPHYNLRTYIKNQGKRGLVAEFRNDYSFQNIVCPYVKEYAKGIEKEHVSDIVKEGISLAEGDWFGIEVDLIVAAVLEACGYPSDAEKVIKFVIGAAIVGSIIGLAFSASRK